jgi:hypothetical protein
VILPLFGLPRRNVAGLMLHIMASEGGDSPAMDNLDF